jgi:KDO2-lipid IV(A) lauroyltransferase
MIYCLLVRTATLLEYAIPRIFTYWIANILGWLYFLIFKKKRKIVGTNLEHIIGKQFDKRLVKKTFLNIARSYADFFGIPTFTRQKLLNLAEFDGISYIQEALAEGKGLIFLTPHLGNWEVGAGLYALKGYKINAPAEFINKERFELYKKYREKTGVKIFPLEGSLEKMTAILKSSGIVGLVGDRNLKGKPVMVKFFEDRYPFPRGPALLSKRTNTPIVTSYLIIGKGKYRLLAEPPIFAQGSVEQITQKIATRFERIIHKYPDQWQVFQPEWSS